MDVNKIPLNDFEGALPAERRDDASAKGSATKVMRLMTEAVGRDSFLVSRPLYTRYAPGLTNEAGRAITRSGMWSGTGFVGASVAAAGLLMLFDGGGTTGVAVAALLAGGATAAYAWRSAWMALDGIDRLAPDATTAAPARGADSSGDGHAAALRIVPAHPRTALAAH